MNAGAGRTRRPGMAGSRKSSTFNLNPTKKYQWGRSDQTVAPKRGSERDFPMKIAFTPAFRRDRSPPIAPKRGSERDFPLKIAFTPAFRRDRSPPIAPKRGSERDFPLEIAFTPAFRRDRSPPIAPKRGSERDFFAKSRSLARSGTILTRF